MDLLRYQALESPAALLGSSYSLCAAASPRSPRRIGRMEKNL
jgi:hypothetical protein